MSLAHAILGFLQWQPMTGYDLKTVCFDQSVAHFWHADQAQIYRTLDRLTEQSFVDSHVEIQMERPNRKVYTITAAGRHELRRWLSTTQELPIHREPFLIQLFFAGQLSNEEIIALLEGQLQQHQALLQHYQQIDIPTDIPIPEQQRSANLQRMTLDMGLRLEQMYSDWLRDCIATIKKGV